MMFNKSSFCLTWHTDTHQPTLLHKYHKQSLQTIWIEAVRF